MAVPPRSISETNGSSQKRTGEFRVPTVITQGRDSILVINLALLKIKPEIDSPSFPTGPIMHHFTESDPIVLRLPAVWNSTQVRSWGLLRDVLIDAQ